MGISYLKKVKKKEHVFQQMGKLHRMSSLVHFLIFGCISTLKAIDLIP